MHVLGSSMRITALPVRLVADAADWINVHGKTPLCEVPGFSPWRFLVARCLPIFFSAVHRFLGDLV